MIELPDARSALALVAGALALAATASRRRPPSGRRSSQYEIIDAAERADGDPVRGSLDADRAPAALVSRRLEEREAGPHRLRAPLRAHDVQGLEERRARSAHVDHRRRSAARATPTRPTTRRCSGRRCRRSTCRWCCGSRPTAWRRSGSTRTRSSNEREVVKEERRMRVDNQPYGRLNEIIYDQAFTTHPYKHPTIGSMAGSRGGVDRRRARLLQDLLRAGERDAGARRRLRYGAGASSWSTQYLGRVPKAERPVPRDIPKEPPQTEGAARHARDAVAAAGGRRRASHHLRRPSRLVSAAHRLEGAVRRPELAHLPEAGVRASSSRSRRSAART